MNRSLDLSSYLEGKQDDGQFQGTGQFTIEHQKAARKMARFALPRSTAWVSKFVQAAVGWSMKSLTVNQGLTYTVFHFEWPKLTELPTEDDVVRGILSSGISDDHPITNLCMGLRALVELEGLSFLLVLNNGDLKPKPIYSGAHFSQMSEAARLSPAFGARPGLTITVAHGVHSFFSEGSAGRARMQAKITKELDTYCFLSPVPITLDGRRVDGALHAPGYRSDKRFRAIYTGGPRVTDGLTAMKVPENFEERRMSAYTDPRRARRGYGGKREVAAVVLLGMRLQEDVSSSKTTIHWVRRGAVVDSQPVFIKTKSLICDLYIEADDLATDLTGFKVSKSDADRSKLLYMSLLRDHLRTLSLEKFAFAADRDEYSHQDEQQAASQATSERIKRVLKGSAAGIGLVLFAPVLGTIVTLGNLVSVYAFGRFDRNSIVRATEQIWADYLDQDRKDFLRNLEKWIEQTERQTVLEQPSNP